MRIALAVHPDTNDLYFDDAGALATVTEALAVGQHVRSRLKTFAGEWFLDTRVGVPWLREIFGKGYDPALSEAVLKACVLDTDGVTDIETFSVAYDRATRGVLLRNITVRTDYDERVTVNG